VTWFGAGGSDFTGPSISFVLSYSILRMPEMLGGGVLRRRRRRWEITQ
jgi:hypothetical protein